MRSNWILMKMCYNILDFRELYYRLLMQYRHNIANYSHSPRVLISIFIYRKNIIYHSVTNAFTSILLNYILII